MCIHFPQNILLCNMHEIKRRKRKSSLIYLIYKNSCSWWLSILHVNENKMHSPENVVFAITSKKLWEGSGKHRGSLPNKMKPLGAETGEAAEPHSHSACSSQKAAAHSEVIYANKTNQIPVMRSRWSPPWTSHLCHRKAPLFYLFCESCQSQRVSADKIQLTTVLMV